MIATGTRLGGYEVIAPIGTGGMGEVYRARDLELGRDVAIKVLPPAFSADPERLARFAREARLLAALNHPHIAGIHGLAETPGVRALVLELVDGPTLAERLREGPIQVAEATEVARQIADALEAAHERGIVHRDLKPANIKLTPGGSVKVLDFGIAKALDEQPDRDRPDSATLTAGGTRAGVVLGTPAYMSPEQSRGQPVDKRTDIWAFGCVLYELLTGRPPFAGETPTDTVSAILSREPDWNALPETVPPHVRTLLQRCLEKDPKRRLRDIGDARIELDSPAASVVTPGTPGVTGRASVRRTAAVAGVVALAMFAAWGWLRPRVTAPADPVRISVRLAPGTNVTRGPQYVSSVALSPDGRLLVIAGRDATGERLYVRPLDRLEPAPLSGTEGGSSPFFSPDGAWIGFFLGRRLKRVPAGGGGAVDIAAGPVEQIPRGAAWLPDDRIVFGTGAFTALQVVHSSGGTPEPLTTLNEAEAEISHVDPHILPDGHTLLFTVTRRGGSWIDALDLRSGQRTRLVQGVAARYAASGHLLLSRGPDLLGAVFDPSRLTLSGPVVPLVEGVEPGFDIRHFAVSAGGSLAYVPAAGMHELALIKTDRSERRLETGVLLENPQFSGEGDRLVVAAWRKGEPAELSIHDLETGSTSRLTFDGGRAPVWTPDGTAVTYSHLGKQQGIYTKAADGRGEARQLVALETFHWLVGWTPDGRTLGYGVMEPVTPDGRSSSSIMALTDGRPRRVVGPGPTWGGRLSPDGKWLAYYSLESSGFEVYVTPFPDGGSRWLVAEGTDPSWAPGGSEIYYRSGNRLMAARIDIGVGVRVLSRRVALDPFLPPAYDDYDIHPDGTLAVVRPVGDAVG
ncbi:MAG TPA: protein kinase, partial [Vicinamibacterales bacterium]|nr:protein kinase [Vicinamibacterales bacterium]